MVDDGIVGVTSNPTIFQKAIADWHRLRRADRGLARHGRVSRGRVLRARDRGRRRARPTRSASSTTTPATSTASSRSSCRRELANDTGRSIAAAPDFCGAHRPAQHLHQDPGHRRGRAGDRGDDRGRDQRQRHAALLAGRLRGDPCGVHPRPRAARGGAASRSPTSHSVASFFVSPGRHRGRRAAARGSPLRGRAAVANAKLAYQRFGEIARADRWQALAAEGATRAAAAVGVDRHEEPGLLGRALRRRADRARLREHDARGHDRGVPGPRRRRPHRRPRRRGAAAEIAGWPHAGVSLDDVTHQLEVDGVKSFSDVVRFADRDDPGESRRAARGLMATTAKRPAPNPLRAGLRVGGATEPARLRDLRGDRRPGPAQAPAGDLQPGRRGLLPGRFALIGYARAEMDDDDLPQVRRAAIEKFSRTPVDDHLWPAFAEILHYQAGGFDEDAQFHALARSPGRPSTPATARRGNRVYYLSTPAEFFPVIVQRDGRGQAEQSRRGFARVVIEKPFGHDLRARRASWPRRAPVVRREPDLPDRPLPGQGDGPEHLRLPVRERDLRAGLEPHATSTTSRSRWPRRSASSTGPRSTRRPASCATSSRTTCCRCSRSWRWSRRRRSTPTGPRREGQAAARDAGR